MMPNTWLPEIHNLSYLFLNYINVKQIEGLRRKERIQLYIIGFSQHPRVSPIQSC